MTKPNNTFNNMDVVIHVMPTHNDPRWHPTVLLFDRSPSNKKRARIDNNWLEARTLALDHQRIQPQVGLGRFATGEKVDGFSVGFSVLLYGWSANTSRATWVSV
jgi:hypothetical protein